MSNPTTSTVLTEMIRQSTITRIKATRNPIEKLSILSEAAVHEAELRQHFSTVELDILGQAAHKILDILRQYAYTQRGAILAGLLHVVETPEFTDPCFKHPQPEPQPQPEPSPARQRAEDDGVFPN